ncbi:MAG: hypothetical protein JF587_09230 [Catenulisporales bacterium]|nr:hypothetical protein [Catenulisporales bacterium]
MGEAPEIGDGDTEAQKSEQYVAESLPENASRHAEIPMRYRAAQGEGAGNGESQKTPGQMALAVRRRST